VNKTLAAALILALIVAGAVVATRPFGTGAPSSSDTSSSSSGTTVIGTPATVTRTTGTGSARSTSILENPEDVVPITFRIPSSNYSDIVVRFPVLPNVYRQNEVAMTANGSALQATVDLPKGGLIRYQYAVSGLDYDHREQLQKNLEVNRYVFADQAKAVNDEVYSFGWQNTSRPAQAYGRLVDGTTGQPVLEAVVVADGVLTLPMDGYYSVDVRNRNFSLIVFALDGSYKTQSVTAGPGEHDFQMARAMPVTVTLNVVASPPQYHQVRVYGTAEQLGMKQIIGNVISADTYTVVNSTQTLSLYDGQPVDYLYTVANPQASYENSNGATVVRSFVATPDLVLNDHVGGFLNGQTVTLDVKVPSYTSSTDSIGVRGVTQYPLFMDKKAPNEWIIQLSDYDLMGSRYLYFKTFAGVGDEVRNYRTVNSTTMNDVVAQWYNQNASIPNYPFLVPAIQNHFQIFGYPADYYSSYHAMFLGQQIEKFKQLGYGGLQLTQVWGFASVEPDPVIKAYEPIPLYMPVYELEKWTSLAHSLGMKMSIEPQLVGGEYLLSGEKVFNETWWSEWYVQMHRFNMQQARAAQAAGVDYLQMLVKLPGMDMPDSYVPTYNQEMKNMIADMRTVYTGQLVVPYEQYLPGVDYMEYGDEIVYVSLNLNMNTTTPTQAQVDGVVNGLFDDFYAAQHNNSGKPLWIKIGYQSIDGAVENNYAPESAGPNTNLNHNYPLDLQEQAMIYQAFYNAANKHGWVFGFYLFGYGFTDVPLAVDVTLNGKPAEAISSAWANAINGTP
jgi:Glycoside Hydrolase Family 113